MKRLNSSCGSQRQLDCRSDSVFLCVQVCWPSLTSSTFSIVITSLLWWAPSLRFLKFLSGPPPSDLKCFFFTSAGSDLRAGRTQDWDLEGYVQHNHLFVQDLKHLVHSVYGSGSLSQSLLCLFLGRDLSGVLQQQTDQHHPGLQVKPVVTIYFHTATQFRGRNYSPYSKNL